MSDACHSSPLCVPDPPLPYLPGLNMHSMPWWVLLLPLGENIFTQDICGGSGGAELLCASCELGLSPQSAGKMAFPAAGEARDGLAVRGSCLGARRGEEPRSE